MAKRVRMQREGDKVRFFMRDDERPELGEKEVSEKEALALLNEVQEPPKNKPLAPPAKKKKKKLTPEELEAKEAALEEAQRQAADDLAESRELAELEAANALDLDDEDEALSPPKKPKASSRSESPSSFLESPAFFGLLFLGGSLAVFYGRRK